MLNGYNVLLNVSLASPVLGPTFGTTWTLLSEQPLSDQELAVRPRGPREGDLRLVGGRSEEEVRNLLIYIHNKNKMESHLLQAMNF